MLFEGKWLCGIIKTIVADTNQYKYNVKHGTLFNKLNIAHSNTDDACILKSLRLHILL